MEIKKMLVIIWAIVTLYIPQGTKIPRDGSMGTAYNNDDRFNSGEIYAGYLAEVYPHATNFNFSSNRISFYSNNKQIEFSGIYKIEGRKTLK